MITRAGLLFPNMKLHMQAAEVAFATALRIDATSAAGCRLLLVCSI
jgi:hypothetical protein